MVAREPWEDMLGTQRAEERRQNQQGAKEGEEAGLTEN